MFRRAILGALSVLAMAAVVSGTDFFASPAGTSDADGSIANPWNLQHALNQGSGVQPGDTIWLRGGTYAGTFVSYLNGTAASPIVVRQYPGERATLDGGNSAGTAVMSVRGSYTWFWGFEVMSSDPARQSSQSGGSPSDIHRGDGMQIWQTGDHPGFKFINLVIHDARLGISFWKEAIDAEINGCLIYYNGWNGTDRGHGHGIYTQNQTGTKHIIDNVIFENFDHGIQAYGSDAAYLDNYDIEGNTFSSDGIIATPDGGRNLLIGGDSMAQNLTIANNLLYYKSTVSPDSAFQLGYGAGCSNAVVTDNYVSNNTFFDGGCLPVTMTGNTFYGATGGFPQSQYPDNTYDEAQPSGVKVFVRPNAYEAGRANITVFNWPHQASVDVDLSGAAYVGGAYEIRNAQDFFGTPVASGIYDGSLVTVPLTGLTVASPVGWPAPGVTGPEFNVFVLLSLPGPDQYFDVPPGDLFYDSIRIVSANGITAGCRTGYFCPQASTLRSEMAVFLLKSEHGSSYAPPAASGEVFDDVSSGAFAAAWIEQLSAEGITGGCSPSKYCPDSPVRRSEVAVFLLKTKHGSSYTPPAATGDVFDDVPSGAFAAAWIEELSAEGITGGCGPRKFCPDNLVTREQMAALIVHTFGLQ
jgi:hypothetical protein